MFFVLVFLFCVTWVCMWLHTQRIAATTTWFPLQTIMTRAATDEVILEELRRENGICGVVEL